MSLQQKIQSLSGFKRYAAAFALGASCALAMPPVGFFPILLLAVPGFIWLSQSTIGKRKSFLLGWAFGAGCFIAGFYWISVALFVDISVWFWVLPLSLIVGPGIFGLYYGFVPLLSYGLRHREIAHTCAFVALWALADYARGHLFTGFPWNLSGYAWDYFPPLLQMASLVGLYGLTLLTLLWAATPILRRNSRALQGLVLGTAFCLSFGTFRLLLTPTTFTDHGVRIVQANIPQGQKWDDNAEWRNFEKHLKLTTGGGASAFTPAFVVWPETSVAADLALYPQIAHMLASSMPGDSIGIIGNLRVTDQGTRFFNSVSVIDKTGAVIGVYDKHHLVPFGEFIPFREYLGANGGLASAVSGIGEFTPGSGAQTLAFNSLPAFSPLICYEVIFPAAVADQKNRPAWLVNVTNDAWYGHSAGPYQHLAITRARAIEEGLPVARAANTGISAMIDPVGRILKRLPLSESGAVDSLLPKALSPTPYAKFGDIFFFMMVALLFIPALRRNNS